MTYPETRGLEVRRGLNTQTGPLAFHFDNVVSPVFEAATLTVSEANDFYQDMLYLNLASVSNPSGEIRGQIITIDYIDEVCYFLNPFSLVLELTTDADSWPLLLELALAGMVSIQR